MWKQWKGREIASWRFNEHSRCNLYLHRMTPARSRAYCEIMSPSRISSQSPDTKSFKVESPPVSGHARLHPQSVMEAMQGSGRGLACAAGAIPFGPDGSHICGGGSGLHVHGGVGVYPQSFSGHRQPTRSLFEAVNLEKDILNDKAQDGEGKPRTAPRE